MSRTERDAKLSSSRPKVKLYRVETDCRTNTAYVEELEAEETAKLYHIVNRGFGIYRTQIEKEYAANQGYHLTPDAAVEAHLQWNAEAVTRAEQEFRAAQDSLYRAQDFAGSDWRSDIRRRA